jgi:YD repeat-containing protein
MADSVAIASKDHHLFKSLATACLLSPCSEVAHRDEHKDIQRRHNYPTDLDGLYQPISQERATIAITASQPMAADLIGYSRRQEIGTLTYSNPNATFSLSPQPISWGEIGSLDFYIVNIGNAASGPYSVGFYLSTDANISTSDILLGNGNLPSIPIQQPVVGYNVSLQMPAFRPAGPAGNYYIGMILDVFNTVAENNEANNSNQGGGRDMVAVTVLPPVAGVTDSIGSSTDKIMSFGSIVNDGIDNASATHALTLSNTAAKSLLKVAQGGVRLASGVNFKIKNILSNNLSQAVNTTSGSSFLAANSTETWTILLTFDPTANGNLSDTLIIETDDPVNPVINVALSGVGLGRGNLSITDSLAAANDQKLDFGDTATDGSGGQFKTATLKLVNNGSGPLTINQNSITLPTGPFTVASIVSSTQGVINLASGAKTLAAASAESWAVSIRFDPTMTGQAQQSLSIASDDADTPIANVTLMGSGLLPAKIAVTDTVAPQNDRLIDFGAVHADGVNLQLARQSVLVTNAGQLPLIVNQNGLSLLNGSQYRIESVNSSLKGSVDLASGSASIAPNASETWTVSVAFDPVLAGNQIDSLRISSNDLTSPLTSVSLSGTGLNQGALVVRDSDPPLDDRSQSFGAILQDGPGGRKTTRSLQLSNVGNQDLLIGLNGIGLQGGTNFRVASIVSSTAGAINLATEARSLMARSAEIWTVAVEFDPTATGSLADTLRILSNDPQQPTTTVALSGVGALPQVKALSPSRVLNASAGNVYSIDWAGQYAPGNAVYSLYYDTDRNPSSGLIQIAANLPQSISSYRWQLPTSLVGGAYTIYVAMNEAGVPGIQAGSYADGSIVIDAAGTDRLLSAPVTDASTYTLTTRVNGIEVKSTQTLAPGTNLVYQTTGGSTREYRINRVATLVDADHSDYDELGNLTATIDADGKKTIYTYDQLSRLTGTKHADGENVAYTYDPAGNLLSMQDGSGWQFYTYDVRDRLTSVTYSLTNTPTDPTALRIGYEYDLSNRLTALIYPSGKRVEYGYTAAGKLNRVTEKTTGQADWVTTYSYSATSGLLLKTTRPNNTETSYGYDANGRLTDIHHKRTDTQATVLRYTYTLDASGRRTGVVVTTETGVRAEKYGYDDFNRLREVSYSDDNGTIDATDRVVRYGYDKNDRRLTQTTFANGVGAGATESLSYAYGFENRLLTVTDQNGVVQERYFYDQQGNQVQKVTPTQTTRSTYDSRNLLTSVGDGSSHIQYVYDGAGRRVAEITNGVTNRLINDPSQSIFQVLEERQQNGAINADYSYGLEPPRSGKMTRLSIAHLGA